MKNLLSHKVRKAKHWLLDQKPVKLFEERFPNAATFVGERFHTKSFIGLPLTLVIAAALVNVGLLSELTESVVDADWVVVADKQFSNMLYSMRLPWLSQFFYLVTQLGEREAVFLIGAIVTGVFVYRRRFVAIIAFWLVMGGVGLSVQYGKTFISRARPADMAYYEVVHYSFPSGHATTAFALYGLLAYFLYRHLDNNRYQKLSLWGAFILIVLVGFSRIYLGVHYLSDVLAGFILGLLWTLVGVSLVEVMMYHRNKNTLNNHT